MKLVFASPTYGPVDSQAIRSQRSAIMHAANNGHQWVGDASPEKMLFGPARNTAVQSALQTEADFVFWCDSDVILPVGAITRLMAAEQDFVCGIYFQRTGDHWPLIADFTGTSFQWCVGWPANVLAPKDGCGFGCVITSTKMLKEMAQADDWNPKEGWFCYKKFSEDFDFCLKAKALGYQLFVDTGVICGHLAEPVPVGMVEFQRKHPEFFKEDANGDSTVQQGLPRSVPAGEFDSGGHQIQQHPAPTGI